MSDAYEEFFGAMETRRELAEQLVAASRQFEWAAGMLRRFDYAAVEIEGYPFFGSEKGFPSAEKVQLLCHEYRMACHSAISAWDRLTNEERESLDKTHFIRFVTGENYSHRFLAPPKPARFFFQHVRRLVVLPDGRKPRSRAYRRMLGVILQMLGWMRLRQIDADGCLPTNEIASLERYATGLFHANSIKGLDDAIRLAIRKRAKDPDAA